MKLFAPLTTFMKKHKYFVAFTLVYFVLALALYKDFGITSDEGTEYGAGKYLLTYFKTPTTEEYLVKLSTTNPHGIHRLALPIFCEYSRIYPMLLNILNPNYYFEWFHLQNIFFGYFLFLSCYLLFFLVYKKSSTAIVGPVLLFLTPVITGHIPTNPKDIPFATVMLLGVLAIHFFGTHQSKKGPSRDRFLLLEVISLGIVFGIAQSLRVIGGTLFVIYFVLEMLKTSSLKGFLNLLLKSITIGIISLFVWILSVPYIGANVFTNLTDVIFNAAAFRFNREVLYFGEILYRQDRPWHYLFVHLLIQLPLLTIFGLATGMFLLSAKKIRYSKKHPIFSLAILTATTFLLYIGLNPVVYNGLRHFLYVVVFLTIISGFMLIDFYKMLNNKHKLLFKVTTLAYFVFTLARMVLLHPYEYIYFNELIGGLDGAEGQFEMDYWGATYKEATKYVGNQIGLHDLKDITVSACRQHLAVDYFSGYRFKRLDTWVGSDVIICDPFELRLREASGQEPFSNKYSLVKTINREGVPIHYIYVRPELTEFF